MAVKTYNFNMMYKALVNAHNSNNRKAITENDCAEAGITKSCFDLWVKQVDDLYQACVAYIDVIHDSKVDFDERLKGAKALRKKIFPAYKAVLAEGEAKTEVKTLRANEADLDFVIGYAEQFVKSDKGTQMAHQTKVMFRKSVESFVGCLMAGNSVLTDEDRDALAAHYKNMSSVKKLTDESSEIEKQKASLQEFIDSCDDEGVKAYLSKKIEAYDVQLEDIADRLVAATELKNSTQAEFERVNNALEWGKVALIKPEE